MLKSIQSIRKQETRCIFFTSVRRLLQMQMILLWALRLAKFSLILDSTQKPKNSFFDTANLYRDGIHTSFKARYQAFAEVVLWVIESFFLPVFRFQRSGFKARPRQVFSLLFLILVHSFFACFSSLKSFFLKFSKNHDWVRWLHFPVVDLPN